MRCCGTLEFLCDFYQLCHKTQQVLQETNAKLKGNKDSSNDEEKLIEKNDKNNEDDESDKENVIPSNKSIENLKKSVDYSDDFNTSSLNKSNSQIIVDENDNPSENLPLEPVIPRSHDTVLTDITDQHYEQSKTTTSRDLFPICKKGVKRVRTSPPVTRKKRQIEQQTKMDSCKAKISNNNAKNIIEDKKLNENSIKSQEIPVIITIKREQQSKKLNNNESKKNSKDSVKFNQNKNQLKQADSSIISSELEIKSEKNKIDDSKVETKKKDTTLNSANSSLVSESTFTVNKNRKSVIKFPNNSTEDKNDKKKNLKTRIRKSKGYTYGRLSDLMSPEQKETIEKLYTLDMSVVDENVVKKNYYANEQKLIVCKICDAVYPRVDKCHVHIWGHLEMKPYRCNECEFATVTVTNIRCHIRKSHLKIKPFECHICNKCFVTAVLLEEHINTHTGARPYQCTICNFSSASRQVLTYHNNTHKTVKDITCDVCKKQFYSKGRLRAHMITHNKDKTLMCKYCSHHFMTTEALQRHYNNVHSKDYVCDTCGKRTKSRKALHNHQNVHLEAKFKCPICPNIYKSSHILKEHLLKHEGIRMYKCDVCSKDFAQQSHLAAHKAVHSEKRYFCPGCQRAFNRQDNMKMHTKRCDKFLANPELKNLITRRSRSSIINNNDGDPDDRPQSSMINNNDGNPDDRPQSSMTNNNDGDPDDRPQSSMTNNNDGDPDDHPQSSMTNNNDGDPDDRPQSSMTNNNDGDPDDINDSNDGFDSKSNEDINETIQESNLRVDQDIIPVSNVQEPVNIDIHAQVTVTENVIGLECF